METKETTKIRSAPRRRRRRPGKVPGGEQVLRFTTTEDQQPRLAERCNPHPASDSASSLRSTTPEVIHLIPRSLLDDSPIQSPQLIPALPAKTTPSCGHELPVQGTASRRANMPRRRRQQEPAHPWMSSGRRRSPRGPYVDRVAAKTPEPAAFYRAIHEKMQSRHAQDTTFNLGVPDLEIHHSILERVTKSILPDSVEVANGFNQCVNAAMSLLKRRSGKHPMRMAQQKRTQDDWEMQMRETKANAEWQLTQMNKECIRLQDKASELQNALAKKVNRSNRTLG